MAKKTKPTEIEEKAEGVTTPAEELSTPTEELSTPAEELNTQPEELSTSADVVEENEFIAYQKAPFLGTFIFRGKKYKFRDGAPDPVRYNDEIMSLEELSQNEDYLLELIAGKSTLIEEYNG
ncbi:hypothetical protein [Ornithobacterium rhinotracheale]|uniref:hypothetical protein n=1 Tax=Ornithobacterium rhinotracheale TaxID=28251 RepID=UPI00129C4645|nr:hypothetical protein [Ornithobacterium rhinotracheale]MRJ07282.1 hypothetical protein [Ornithobacterium rhinotracheale]UOH77884.1 hypothetical protein MT996_00080 [Ornithobacterium rhinotracheale]